MRGIQGAFLFFVVATNQGPSDREIKDRLARLALTGLGRIAVLIETLPAAATDHGLTEDSFQTAVELQLRQSGVRVFTPGANKPCEPCLYVRVGVLTVNASPGLCAYTVAVEVQEAAQLVRPPRPFLAVTTWRTGNYGVMGCARIREIREDLKDHVDEFLNGFLAANRPGR